MTETTEPAEPTRRTVRDLFETEVCSRCGGSGEFSWNALHGSRCYGCNGRGWRFSKRGAEARDAWVAAFTRTKRADEVVAGDKVMVAGRFGREVCVTVVASEPDELNVGQNRWTFTFEPDNKSGYGGYGTFRETEFRLPASAEEKRQAYAAVADMPGAISETLW